MTEGDQGIVSLIQEAERRGKEAERNDRRVKAADVPPVAVKRADGRPATIDSVDAVKLFEFRKRRMLDGPGDAEDRAVEKPKAYKADLETEKAVKEAEAVRRVEDMKNGRINHAGTWEGDGSVEGGDLTVLPAASSDLSAPGKPREKPKSVAALFDVLNEWKADLYSRLKVSFEGLEGSLSDLQGRISEIVTASTPAAPLREDGANGEFESMLSKSTPVTFDVGGTKMSYDAVTVFHAPPCITVVSKSGSATIMPKPGARLLLSYEMNGERYKDDPVTFLGTRFELPMFGLSFVGFIRDVEAGAEDPASDGGV